MRISRKLRRATGAVMLTLSLVGVSVTAWAAPAHASWHPAEVGSWTPNPGVSVRDCYHPTVQLPPSTSCTYQTSLPAGTPVHVVCQRAGQFVGGNNVWDYVVYSGGEGFVSDYYMDTGYMMWIVGIDYCQ